MHTWYIDRACHWPTEAAIELAAKHVANTRTGRNDMGEAKELTNDFVLPCQ